MIKIIRYIVIILFVIIIGAIVLVRLGTIIPDPSKQAGKRMIELTKSDIKTTIYSALKRYEADNGDFPTTEQGLNALVSKPTLSPIPNNWKGPYLDNKPNDMWDHPYRYTYLPNESYLKISSSGRDGMNSTEDDIEQAIKIEHRNSNK